MVALRASTILSALWMTSPVFAGTITFGTGGNEFQIEFVTVGNAGNAADVVGGPNGTVAGGVPYVYQIGRYEVTTDMISKANAASEDAGVPINVSMDTTGTFGPNRAERPATGISWLDAARFVNWLNTSAGVPPAYKFIPLATPIPFLDPETVREWHPREAGYDPANPLRNSEAMYVLPTIDEWYKAAYHDAAAGVTGGYFDYATGSDAEPLPVAGGSEPGTAVFNQPPEQGPADAKEAGGPSPYGTIGQTGNVGEWHEYLNSSGIATHSDSRWPMRAGSKALRSEDIGGGNANQGDVWTGFRVARVSHPLLVGDFDSDGVLTPLDIDQLAAAIRDLQPGSTFDLTRDGTLNAADHTFWVEEIAATLFGDADLNGTVEFADFLALSAAYGELGGWAGGDFDGNGTVEFADFLVLSKNFGESRPSASVPEPSSYAAGVLLLCLGSLRWNLMRKRGPTSSAA